jgi:hypothetical protein
MASYEFADVHGSVLVTAPIAEGPGAPPLCGYCGNPLSRVFDFGLGNVTSLRRERERGGSSAVRDLFLPTRKDFEGPTDPDGTKGLREWADTHEPKPGNKNPLYPADIPKRSW